jgi:FkbM family methyltransferase
MNRLKTLVQNLFTRAGFNIYRSSSISGYSLYNDSEIALNNGLTRIGALIQFFAQSNLTAHLPVRQLIEIIRTSKSQLGQDILALSLVGLEKRGYFLEFGATNGLELSNTYILEKSFGWKGILCEPAVNWHEDLYLNRSSIIDTRCVYIKTNEQLDFLESRDGELSTLGDFVKSDSHERNIIRKYKVTTVTLEDLLIQHMAPKFIDFMSIDTEGSEYLILRDFCFEKYRFGLICVEHNNTENREKIFNLLTKNGYRRVYEEHSKWDDWYVGDTENKT